MRLPTVLLVFGFLLAAPSVRAACPPDGYDLPLLQALKGSKFAIEDANERNTLAIGLLDCLSSPDPQLRDGIAFEAWTTWLRSEQLDAATRLAALERLQAAIDPANADAEGFAQPFSALVLAEVARTDRLKAWLTPEQRAALVESSARYLESVRDYRGFVAGEGWRHGVAHGSDLLMQLALNPALEKPQLDRILAAVATQVAPAGQAYVFGEPERLARPVLFVAAREKHTGAEWAEWLAKLSAAPEGGWQAVFVAGGDGLARKHNLRAFLLGLYLRARESPEAGVQWMLPGIKAQLEAVP